jgi:putative hemolysin
MKRIAMMIFLCGLTACAVPSIQPASTSTAAPQPEATSSPQTNLPNPASVYCEQQGYRLEIRSAADGSQNGFCVFPDGSECEEWAFFRGECGPTGQTTPTSSATEIPTPLPVDLNATQGWWTYTQAVYGFSILLPEDWTVEEMTDAGSTMSGHALSLRPRDETTQESIYLTFRSTGEETLLWPTGVGQGEFIQQGSLEIAGQPALRWLLVCPTGEITSLWYHQAEDQANLSRGNLEFGVIFRAAPTHCETGYSLGGKTQRLGETIIASLKVP